MRPMTNRGSRMRMTSPSVLPSSKTVSSGDRRPGRRPERAGRPRHRLRLRDGRGHRRRRGGHRPRDRRLPLQAGEQRLADVVLGLDQGAGPLDVRVRLPGRLPQERVRRRPRSSVALRSGRAFG